jgi:hypothetical protein
MPCAAISTNSATSAWLSTPPLSSETAYRMRDEEYVLAVRHWLGLLPYDDLRDERCVACASRDLETPALLVDPNHAHSCVLADSGQHRDATRTGKAHLSRTSSHETGV